jgi:predicted ATPase/DNA-binding SARP family transcriptional activator
VAEVRVELTGGLRVIGGDGRIVDAPAFPGRQGRLLFTYLAASCRPVPRDELAEALWPENPPLNWKRDLSVLVSKLRRLLLSIGVDGAELLTGTGGCYHLRLPAGAVVDIHQAVAEADESTRALRHGDLERALAAATSAAELARRPFLAGEDASWIVEHRAALDRARLAALDVAAQVLRDRGDLTQALARAAEAVEVAPFRESGNVSLMRLQLAAGDRAEALRTYEQCRRLLVDELGVDPAPETEAVYLEALRTDLAPLEAGPSRGEATAPGNLPARVTSFVGRDREIEKVADILRRARLVTLTGVGGVGKSRLALESAARLAGAYRDGAWMCEFARVAGSKAVAHALAGALGVYQRPDLTMEESLVDFLRTKQALLILDNCEHVLNAVTPIVRDLLRGCARLAVLATSRERLGLGGEHVLPVEALTVPAPGTDTLASTTGAAALQLFCDRASAARHGFGLTPDNAADVADVCRRLDGLPLAIELAAARLSNVSIKELVLRLEQRFELLIDGPMTDVPRHRTLRQTVDWSYELLSIAERRVFDQLSVFAGRFTLDAATAVCAGPTEEIEVAMGGLVDRSMVVADTRGPRTLYRLLETLRIYGRERLAEGSEAEAAPRRHAEYYVASAETAARKLCGPDEVVGAIAFQQEWDDLRAVRRRSVLAGDVDLALRLSGALYWYSLFRMSAEAPVWAEQAAALPGADTHPLFPLVCATAGVGCWMRGDLARALTLGQRGLEAAGGGPSRRFPLDILGAVAIFEGRLEDAFDHFMGGVKAAREAGDYYHETHLLGDAALVYAYQGHSGDALRAAAEARRIAGTAANPSATAWGLYVNGEILLRDDPDRAIALLDASIELSRSVGSTFALGVALVSASSVRARQAIRAGPCECSRRSSSTGAAWGTGRSSGRRCVMSSICLSDWASTRLRQFCSARCGPPIRPLPPSGPMRRVSPRPAGCC